MQPLAVRRDMAWSLAWMYLLLGALLCGCSPCAAWQARCYSPPHCNTHGKKFLTSSLHSISAGFGSGGDPVLRLPLIEAELAILLSNIEDTGDSSSAARRLELEEAINDAKTAAEFSVRRAQLEFYSVFSLADLDAMDKVWSREVHVRCVHPGMASLEGREEVMQSWAEIFLSSPAFQIEPARSRIEICGRTAVCSCIEETPDGGRLEALNIYRREGGNWRMTLHMASPVVPRIVANPGF